MGRKLGDCRIGRFVTFPSMHRCPVEIVHLYPSSPPHYFPHSPISSNHSILVPYPVPALQSFVEVVDQMRADPYLSPHIKYYMREMRVVAYAQVSENCLRMVGKGCVRMPQRSISQLQDSSFGCENPSSIYSST